MKCFVRTKNSKVRKVKKKLVVTFDKYCYSGLYTSKWTLFVQISEDIR